MKKIIVAVTTLAILVACNSGGDGKKDEPAKSADTDMTSSPDYKPGLTLVANNTCPTCHKLNEKFTGPSYQEIADKYGSEPKDVIVPKLASKVISGGTGVWGSAIMIPNPSVTQADAETMVKYILLLKTK